MLLIMHMPNLLTYLLKRYVRLLNLGDTFLVLKNKHGMEQLKTAGYMWFDSVMSMWEFWFGYGFLIEAKHSV